MSTLSFSPHLSLFPAPQQGSLRTQRPVRPQGPVRLTRRGRLVVLVASLVLALAAAFLLADAAFGTSSAGKPIRTEIVQVVPGDTLWDIASERVGDGDVRSMIDQIRRLNALESGNIMAGQKIRVPLMTE